MSKLWHRVKSNGEAIGIPLLILGFLFIVGAFIITWFGGKALELLWSGIGVGSFGLGFIAVGVSMESDNRMQAIAAIHFDEKLVILWRYAPPPTPRKDVYYDARAALRLALWANEPTKHEFRCEMARLIERAKSGNDTQLVTELEDLWQQYSIEKW